jgi:ATP-dependent DNA ligase
MARSVARQPRAAAAAPPEWIRPQLTELVDAAPDGPDWLHEIKFDGYRTHARLDGGAVRLLTRTGLDWTHKYPAIATAVASLPATQAYLDGELCGVRSDGITSFSMIQAASDSGNAAALVFFLFDILYLDGDDVSAQPQIERKTCLAALLSNAGSPLHYCDHQIGHGWVFHEKACAMALEGIVSKRADAVYAPGNRGFWVKVKCLHREEFVVGWTDPEGAVARRVAARLLRSRRETCVCRPRRHRHQTGGAGAAVAKAATAGRVRNAARGAAAARQPLRIAAGVEPRALGAARAGRRGELSHLDRR